MPNHAQATISTSIRVRDCDYLSTASCLASCSVKAALVSTCMAVLLRHHNGPSCCTTAAKGLSHSDQEGVISQCICKACTGLLTHNITCRSGSVIFAISLQCCNNELIGDHAWKHALTTTKHLCFAILLRSDAHFASVNGYETDMQSLC